MPLFKTVFHIFSAATLLLLSSTAIHAQPDVNFSWAVLTDTATGLRTLDFSATPQLQTGTTLQIYIEQKPGAFIYLFLLDSRGGLEFIFPGEPDYYNVSKPSDQIIRIPPDSARFELTPPGGQEKLYLLASPTRLVNLEKLTAAYLKNPQDTDKKATVIKELKTLRRQHSSLTQKTETSVPVAGTIRSRGIETELIATQVTIDAFYSRILRINHE